MIVVFLLLVLATRGFGCYFLFLFVVCCFCEFRFALACYWLTLYFCGCFPNGLISFGFEYSC